MSLRQIGPTQPVHRAYASGAVYDVPHNWTGSPSGAGVGLFNTATATFYLKNQLTNGAADSTFVFGSPGDQPVAGNWPSPPPQKPASAPQPTP